ncbi:hypothetical protein NUW58_g1112 [Xylaria curta]|uniref:Uncharacterized protein n=2 Tax=Xylaria curta TaxID=42375 RepID=A0ACC1PM89_9PEZI|nr:hypothetical protein NUW58_g4898 [Xylaria curta]KAJ2996029.1 hypothetical protein NUW58_g1112 [Xylaria curta]
MAESPVLCFPVSGQEDGSFLMEVSSNGSRPLDLKFIGSESTAVFVAKLRHKKIGECKASPGHCTDEEWEQILSSTFVDLRPVPGIEAKADVQSDGTSVILSFRKNIQGITQRLGSIKLDENDKTEISPFDWCVSAITSRTKVTDELAVATAKIQSLEHSINELKAQLEEFITAKEEDETQMLEKFRDLLNEKKLKIRQQHRLLAAAKVDPEKLANIRGDDIQDAHRNAGPSRSNKRKALVKEEDESDDGFEKMDVDKQDNDDNASNESQSEFGSDVDENRQLSTDEDATASDPDTDDEPQTRAEAKRKEASPPGRITKPKVSTSKQTAGPSRSTRAATQNKTAAMSDSEDGDDTIPPPRTLPFMGSKKKVPPPKPADDDETQSDDDSEL